MLALGASLRQTAKEAEQGALARVADERRRSLGSPTPRNSKTIGRTSRNNTRSTA
jgi:hypothetical protein